MDTVKKTCRACGASKDLSCFRKGKGRGGLRSQCSLCLAEKGRIYYAANRQKAMKATTDWRKNHPEHARDTARKRYARIRSTPVGKLNHAVSVSVHRALRSGAKAGARWQSMMGYTLAQLMQHIEDQFTPEMSWSNYGSYWQLDHKRPIASFHFTSPEDDTFKKCWALDNLQPLTVLDNQRKGSRIV
ncbi:MAG: hypothetical protein WC455_30795 [Dehalococcoidia bacterium]|jgi:hypothetical protein